MNSTEFEKLSALRISMGYKRDAFRHLAEDVRLMQETGCLQDVLVEHLKAAVAEYIRSIEVYQAKFKEIVSGLDERDPRRTTLR